MGSVWLLLALAATAAAQDIVPAPRFTAADVVNAADNRSGPVAPSEVVVVYAANAGPPGMIPWAVDPMHLEKYSVETLGKTRVLFDGAAAPMVYAESGRLCAIVPYRVSGSRTTDMVVEYEGRQSAPVTLAVVPSAPAVFTLDASGAGQAAMLNETGCCNSLRNPAVRGTIATLYATGEGLPLPGVAPSGSISLPMKVTLGGVPAPVVWKGNTGVLQLNFRIPANAPVGDAIPLVLTVGDIQSSPAVTMAIRPARQQVLVVAGELAIRQRLATILAGAGYEVLGADGWEHAKGLALSHNVDLVIADLKSPAEQSGAAMRAIREAHPLLKTLAISGGLTSESLRAADMLGAQAVVTRPLVSQAVLERVRALLVRRPAVY